MFFCRRSLTRFILSQTLNSNCSSSKAILATKAASSNSHSIYIAAISKCNEEKLVDFNEEKPNLLSKKQQRKIYANITVSGKNQTKLNFQIWIGLLLLQTQRKTVLSVSLKVLFLSITYLQLLQASNTTYNWLLFSHMMYRFYVDLLDAVQRRAD